MTRPRCVNLYGCTAPTACAGWGYCRQRNIDAGGMRNVTERDQMEWRVADAPERQT